MDKEISALNIILALMLLVMFKISLDIAAMSFWIKSFYPELLRMS